MITQDEQIIVDLLLKNQGEMLWYDLRKEANKKLEDFYSVFHILVEKKVIRAGIKYTYLEYDPNFDCERCGICCKEYWKSGRRRQFYLIDFDKTRYEELGRSDILSKFEKHEFEEPNEEKICPYLEEVGAITRCKIHEIRPVICWAYNCKRDKFIQNRKKHAKRTIESYSLKPAPMNRRRRELLGRLISMIEQVETDWETLPFEIKEIYVFGSILTRKPKPHDIDVLVIYGKRRKEILPDEEFMRGPMSMWKTESQRLKKILKRRRLLELHFENDFSFRSTIPNVDKITLLKVWSKEEQGTEKWRKILRDTFGEI